MTKSPITTPSAELTPEQQQLRQRALSALRRGDFAFALHAIERGEASVPEMVEDLKIYQAELEIQNEELRQSQQQTETALHRFSQFFASLPLPALVVDTWGVVQECNHAAIQRFDLRPSQLRSHFLPRLVHKRDHARLRDLLERVQDQGVASLENIALHTADRETFIADMHAGLLPQLSVTETPSHSIILTLVDQTEALRQQEALEASRRHFMAYFERAPVGMAATGSDKRFLEVNDRLCEMLGFARDELLRLDWSTLTHPDDLGERLVLFNRVLTGEIDHYALDQRLIRKDGAVLEVHIATNCLRSAQGGIDYFVSIIEDISTRKRAERQLQDHEQRLQEQSAQLTARIKELRAVYTIARAADRSTDRKNLIAEVLRVVPSGMRYPEDTMVRIELEGQVYQTPQTADFPGTRPILSATIHDGSEIAGSLRVAYRSVHALLDDGPFFNEEQTFISSIAEIIGQFLQRQYHERLLQLHAEVFRSSREGIIITDAATRILSVNRAFTAITGYSAEEAIGKTPALLKSGRHDAAFYQQMWQELSATGHWQGEIWNRKKHGDIYPEWLGITAVRAPNGTITGYIGVLMDISDYKSAQQHIEFLAHHDALTGLPNRVLLRDRFQQTLALGRRENVLTGLLYLDLDRFKHINDTFGHPAGDQLLLEAAQRLTHSVRGVDTVSRLGGDEFVLILSHVRHPDAIADVAKKILLALAQPFDIAGNSLNISGSIGISLCPHDGEDFDTLLQKADTALYQAKARGRNNYQFFTHEMHQHMQHRVNLENKMRQGLAQQQFLLHYQPQFDLRSGRLIGVEALLRWQHPHMGWIPPSDFIPIAEECGFIVELGHFVMREACRQAKLWLDRGQALCVAINVSYVQFTRNNLLGITRQCLEDSGLPPHYLEIELTESTLAAEPDKVLEVVNTLQSLGVRFAIDDFGTGYSNLSYLKRFAIDRLKIDQSFVCDLQADNEDVNIVRAIIQLARSLNIRCIAEGIEKPEQAELLLRLDCEEGQGYLFARPMPPEHIDTLWRDSSSS